MAGLRTLPADIAVYAATFGAFPAAQPTAFAHLWEAAPDLDLDHVEIVPVGGDTARLSHHFNAATIAMLRDAAGDDDTLILVLPAAHDGLDPPEIAGVRALGAFRGQVHRLDGPVSP